MCTGYLVRTEDAQSFIQWAKGVDFWGRWMPDAAELHGMYLGEHAWSPASRYFQRSYYNRDDGWTQPGQDCPVKIRTMAVDYRGGSNGFDCSVDSLSLCLPVPELIAGLGIKWSGSGADFLDSANQLATQVPTIHGEYPSSAFLLGEDLLKEYLKREKLTICWAILGEKRVNSPGYGCKPVHPRLRISGAYVFSESGPKGFVNHYIDQPDC